MSFLAGGAGAGNKRKHAAARMYSPPPSPSGVIGALSGFSCESSSSATADSRPASTAAAAGAWAASVSSSPEPAGRAPKRAAAALPVPHPLPPDEESRDAWPPSTSAAWRESAVAVEAEAATGERERARREAASVGWGRRQVHGRRVVGCAYSNYQTKVPFIN